VLGVLFGSKLQWSQNISKTIAKANHSRIAIKLIRRFSNTKNCYVADQQLLIDFLLQQ
jgi:hypothetical protein